MNSARTKPRFINRRTKKTVSGGSPWTHYEDLKTRYTSTAKSQLEYEAACRRAAAEAGV